MGLIEWAVLGLLLLVAMVMSARVMRRGISTLDDKRKQCLEHIAVMDRQLAEDRKNMTAKEHLAVMRAAVEDLVRLEDFPEGWEVKNNEDSVELLTSDATWKIKLLMRERDLKTAHRVLHGKGRWHLSGPEIDEFHVDPASLMHSLDDHLHARSQKLEVPAHLAKRMRHLPQEPH